ncbi:MAG: glycosyltransferase family 4 protein [Salinivirgaceae bacterium]
MHSPKSKYIICSHLLNNYSGSPLVLSQVVKALNGRGYPVKALIGNKAGQGFLSGLPVTYRYSFYRFKENKLLRLLFLFGAQAHLFFMALFTVRKKDCALIYANTLYSFGVALAGKLKGIPVVYHIHETSLKPPLLKRFLVAVVRLTASKTLFVSRAHRQLEAVKGIPARVLYNCLDSVFYKQAMATPYQFKAPFVVLMVCSLKPYKGVYEFLELARKLENRTAIRFKLVVNANRQELAAWYKEHGLPENLSVFESQQNLVPFYTEAHLVLNLSRPNEVIETFGLTLLEALTFGIPVIAPPVGGPTELVDEGENGYLLSCYKLEKIAEKIIELSQNPELCLQLSSKAREKARQFSPELFERNLLQLINE